MKKLTLAATWVAVAVYCILTGVFGPAGYIALTQARDISAAMLSNIVTLEKLNAEYSSEWNALRSDASLTAIEGRSLGYIASNEVVVRVSLPGNGESPEFIGERVLYKPGFYLPDDRIRVAALYTWLGVMIVGLARRLAGEKKTRGAQPHHILQAQREIRVQEASRT